MKILQKKSTYIPLIILILLAASLFLWQFSTPNGNNIVLIVSDAMRKDVLGCYGGEAKTPNIDWLAQNGVLFENACTASPGTIFSSTSLFTGNYPTSYNNKPVPEMDDDIPLIFDGEILPAELLRQAGFDVRVDTENHLIDWILRGFEKIKTYDELTSSEIISIERIMPREAGGNCYKQMYGLLNYLLTKPEERFFVLKWILDPHSPYNPPDKFKKEMKIDLSRIKGNFYSDLLSTIGGNFAPVEKYYLKELYKKEVESVDERLGYILKALEYRNLLEDTCIVFTADHGELFGEHGEWSHGHYYYEELVNIPLIITGPGIPKGKRVSNIVSNVDLIQTLKDLLGAEYQYKSQGKSFINLLSWNPLKQLFYSITNRNAAYFVSANHISTHKDAIRDNHYKLICCKDNTYELYNLLDDPHETRNLSKNNPNVVNKMISKLNDIREEIIIMKKNRTQVGDSIPINTDFIEQLKALGYVGSQPQEEIGEQKVTDGYGVINEQNIWIEAEHADTLVSPFRIGTDEKASNGMFIFTPNGTGNESDPGGSIMATYIINIDQSGVYFLWGRAIAFHGGENSFFVQIDDNPEKLWMINESVWHWNKITRGIVGFYLTTGKHTIKIKLREDGSKLDKLLLTNAMGSIPSGIGNM